jgi:predicted dehydrogenase
MSSTRGFIVLAIPGSATMKVAISGFRHAHVTGIVKQVQQSPHLQIVAACEKEPAACREIIAGTGMQITHGDFDAMLKSVACDALVVGSVYADRGAEIIKALEAGKHIVADKPLCTRPEEMRQIRRLAEKAKRTVIVALDLRYDASCQTARRLLRAGAIGEVVTGSVLGQHGLAYKTGRPDWYFEKDRHGGTINDLMVHGMDSLLFMTGHPVVEVIAARTWHSEPREAPFFRDAAQAMLRLKNDAGILMEASYKTPKGHGAPWEFRFWGTDGELHVVCGKTVTLRRKGEPAQQVEIKHVTPGDCVADFVHETIGLPGHQQVLTTAESLDASEKAVLTQAAADEERTHVGV